MTVRKVLLATDFSEHSDHALDVACDLAARVDATLELLHVYQVPGVVTATGFVPPPSDAYEAEEASVNAALNTRRRTAETAGVREVTTHAREGFTVEVILHEAEMGSADLIVVGTHGRTGFRRAFLGSVAENVLRHARRPVLVVPLPPHEPDSVRSEQ
jgi:nucleotide-binding universal stress UspA family protein